MPSSSPLFRALWVPVCLLGIAGLTACGAEPADQAPPQRVRERGDPALGLQLMTQYQCGSCHAIPGVPAVRGVNGPSLQAFGKRSYIAGRVPNFPDALAQWIVAPASFVPDTAMPAMGVSQEEARHMAAYLGQLE